MEYNPLVSVGILTYNSAKYIVDALDSVKDQTYENIELIVSDDCSKDNTVEICRRWIETNKSRFVNTNLITVEKNTGTSANCNRLLAACKGEWLKELAGDDALFQDSIEEFIRYINSNPEAKCVVGCIKEYRNTFEEQNVVEVKSMHFHNNDKVLDESAEKQFMKLIHGNSFIPPASIINVQVMRDIGGYDEKYGILEDYPFYLKMLKAGFKIYGMDKAVLKYRSSDTNVWASSRYLFNYKHRQMDYCVKKDMCFPYYKWNERLRCHLFYGIYYIMNKLGMRKRNRFNRAVEVSSHFLVFLLLLDVKGLKGYFSKLASKLSLFRWMTNGQVSSSR